MTAVDALQTTLAGEHAAVYLYGVLGGSTSQSASPALYAALREGYAAHRAQRDLLVRSLRDLGVEPVAAAAAYEAPTGLATASDVAREAAGLEVRCATTYAALVAETVGDQRRWAVAALTASAVRRTEMGAAPEIFPGAADLTGS